MKFHHHLFRSLIVTFLSYFAFLYSSIAQEPFTDITVECGIVSPSDPNLPLEHDGFDENDIGIGTGAAFFDYDNDGYLDLYLTTRTGTNYMYRNNGPDDDYSFTDVTAELGLEDSGGDGSGVAVADYDNDGWVDIFLCNADEDLLFRNNKGQSFIDVTASSGISTTDDSRTCSASWGDYDNDGFLDLFLSRHMPYYLTNSSTQDILYHNNGDGTFTDVSNLFNISDLMGYGFIGGFSDYDNDGDLDIFVINDCNFNQSGIKSKVFRNDGGTDPINNWTFIEVGEEIGFDICSNPMGIGVGDIDHNGFQDYVVSDIGPINLWTNEDGIMTDISSSAGVNNQPPHYYSWGINFMDYDLDGWLDLFVAEGAMNQTSDINPQHNYFYENNGGDGLTYTDKSALLAMDDVESARTSIFGDFDEDGDPDFLIINYGEEVMMKKNNVDNGNNWFKVKLEGVESNRDGIGSKIKLTTGSMVQHFETRSGSSLGGGDDLVAYFGMGTNSMVDELQITWPSGIVQTLTNLSPNQKIIVVEESVVPIQFMSFEAILMINQVILEWSTAFEYNNDKFVIEKGSDGMNFKEIAQVTGVGSSNKQTKYNYIDDSPLLGVNYYRIKQLDHNGEISYSMVKRVDYRENGNLRIYPNPVLDGYLNLKTDANLEISHVEIINLSHQRILEYSLDGKSNVMLDISKLAGGIYFLKIELEGQMVTRKLIVH